MALAATNAPSIPSDYLKSISGSKATDYETAILAITALNKDLQTLVQTTTWLNLKTFV